MRHSREFNGTAEIRAVCFAARFVVVVGCPGDREQMTQEELAPGGGPIARRQNVSDKPSAPANGSLNWPTQLTFGHGSRRHVAPVGVTSLDEIATAPAAVASARSETLHWVSATSAVPCWPAVMVPDPVDTGMSVRRVPDSALPDKAEALAGNEMNTPTDATACVLLEVAQPYSLHIAVVIARPRRPATG